MLETKLNWYSVNERLPDDDTTVLVAYSADASGHLDVWLGWHEGTAWFDSMGGTIDEPLFWCDLPEPPEVV